MSIRDDRLHSGDRNDGVGCLVMFVSLVMLAALPVLAAILVAMTLWTW